MAGVATDGAGVPGPDAPQGTCPGDPPQPPRSAPPAAPTSQIPRRAINAIVASALGLLLLTVVINRVATSAAGSKTTTTPTTLVHPVVGGTVAPLDSTELHAPLRDLLDLTRLEGQHASGFSLTDAGTGKAVSLASLRGRVVVLTFADADCNDICPVLAAELHAASAELGGTSVPVSFVTVNTDPFETAPKDATIVRQPLFASLPGWMFLTGSVRALDPVWKDYGISITADPTSGVVSHNELMYFITAKGTLAWSALPFADESDGGSYSLPRAEIARFASGIAHYVVELAK